MHGKKEDAPKTKAEIYSDAIILALIEASAKAGAMDYNAALAALFNADACAVLARIILDATGLVGQCVLVVPGVAS